MSQHVCSSGLKGSLQINYKQFSNEPDVRRNYFIITDVIIYLALTHTVSIISIRIITIKSCIIIVLLFISFMQGIYNYISRRMRWAGHVARMGEERGCMGSWWGNRREGNHWGDLGADG